MVLQHSDPAIGRSFRTVNDTNYKMEPEFLNEEELEHELRIRLKETNGDKRDKSKRLRDALKMEENKPVAKICTTASLQSHV